MVKIKNHGSVFANDTLVNFFFNENAMKTSIYCFHGISLLDAKHL